MLQWVKNLPAAAWVTVEAWVPSPAWSSGLKFSAVAQIQSLAWELPYAAGVAVKKCYFESFRPSKNDKSMETSREPFSPETPFF